MSLHQSGYGAFQHINNLYKALTSNNNDRNTMNRQLCLVIKSATDKCYLDKLRSEKRLQKKLVAQVAPAVRVAIGEPFGKIVKPTQIVTSLKKIGFDYVFDTLFSADLTIIEESNELIKNVMIGKLPMFTSCCPGWYQLVQSSFPELMPNISTSKSPQQMMGAIIKQIGIHPSDVYSVSFMPCMKKQAESERMHIDSFDGIKDVDLVITTQELVNILKEQGIDPTLEDDTPFDNPMGEGTGGGAIFGRTGGVMTAAIRYAYKLLSGNDLPADGIKFQENSVIPTVKEAEIQIPLVKTTTSLSMRIAIVVGLADAKKYVLAMKDGKVSHDFIEVMACVPAGCVSGGGQPPTKNNKDIINNRKDAMNAFDDGKAAHDNTWVDRLYSGFLGDPNSEQAHKYLHYEPDERKNKND
jgi:NADH-quinone oxidoreductase subunit G